MKLQRRLPTHDARRQSPAIAWSDDGSVLLTADDCQIRRWEVSSGKLLSSVRHRLPVLQHSADEVWRFSSDLTRLATTGSVCRVVSSSDAKLQASIVPLGEGRSAVISSDGHYLGTPKAEDELVYVVQTAAGQELLSSKEFAEKYGWKNDPSKVVLP